MSYRSSFLLPGWRWIAFVDATILLFVWGGVLVFSNITAPVHRTSIASWGLVFVAVTATSVGFWFRRL